MEKTLRVLNRMVKDGVIEQYAIGGAVAAIFYVEPINTNDVDVFFHVKDPSGYRGHKETIDIEGWPVQFLPVFNSLLEEGVAQARDITFQRTKTRVMQAEHLVAIMLQTGRLKDHARIAQFVEHEVIDQDRLTDILVPHELIAKWKKLNRGK